MHYLRRRFYAITMLVALLAGVLFCGTKEVTLADTTRTGVVKCSSIDTVNTRTQASINSEIINKLANGKVVYIEEEVAGSDHHTWYYVTYYLETTGEEKKGYIRSDFVTVADNSLSSMTLSAGELSPAFDPAVTSYSATVDYEVTELIVNATCNDPGAVVELVSGNVDMSVGENLVTVDVVGSNNAKLTYQILVTRSPESSGVTTDGAGVGNGMSASEMLDIKTRYESLQEDYDALKNRHRITTIGMGVAIGILVVLLLIMFLRSGCFEDEFDEEDFEEDEFHGEDSCDTDHDFLVSPRHLNTVEEQIHTSGVQEELSVEEPESTQTIVERAESLEEVDIERVLADSLLELAQEKEMGQIPERADEASPIHVEVVDLHELSAQSEVVKNVAEELPFDMEAMLLRNALAEETEYKQEVPPVAEREQIPLESTMPERVELQPAMVNVIDVNTNKAVVAAEEESVNPSLILEADRICADMESLKGVTSYEDEDIEEYEDESKGFSLFGFLKHLGDTFDDDDLDDYDDVRSFEDYEFSSKSGRKADADRASARENTIKSAKETGRKSAKETGRKSTRSDADDDLEFIDL